MLFSRSYSDTIEAIVGTRDVLNKHSKQAGTKFLKLKHIGELEFKQPHAGAEKPENKIGVRREPLRKLTDIEHESKASAESKSHGTSSTAGAGTGIDTTTTAVTTTVNIPGMDFGGGGGGGDSAVLTHPTISHTGPRKTLKQILQEHKRVEPVTTSASTGKGGEKDGKDGKGKPKPAGKDGDAGGARTGAGGGTQSALKFWQQRAGKWVRG